MQTVKVGILNTACVTNFTPYLIDLKNHGYEYEILDCPEYSTENVEKLAAYCKEKGIGQVLACGMNEIPFHGALNERLASHSTGVDVINLFKNKFIQRRFENNPLMWYAPANLFESDEEIAKRIVEYPCMMKATAFYLGYYIYKLENQGELFAKLKELRSIEEFVKFDKSMQEIHSNFPKDIKPEIYPSIVFERMLDLGKVRQFSCDTYTTDNYCQVYNIREEQYFKSSVKLGYMFPPLNFSKKIAEDINAFITNLGGKMAEKGLKWHFFNFEVFYTENEEVILTEVNILFNINFVHVQSLLDNVNKIKIIFDLQLKKIMSKEETPYFGLIEGKYNNKMCLQSVIQVLKEGKAGDYINYDEVMKFDNTENSRIIRFIEPEEFISQSLIPVPGFDCVDIWFTEESQEKLFEKDKAIRAKVMKNIDQETLFIYPNKQKS